jgi:SAM-dependent methyltransferase
MSTTQTTTSPAGSVEAWREAGRAWGHAAVDWAYLFEPYGRDGVETVLALAAVGEGTDLLDVACGSGLAAGRAQRMGATVAGIDASDDLVRIARRRAPGADVRAGDMFALPWPDGSFDVVTSFNGIWGGCDAAVAEMARVLRPGGVAAVTFWGAPSALGLREYFIVLGTTMPEVATEMIGMARIGDPGVAEEMFTAAGLEVTARGVTSARLELADDEVAWRALRSPGLAVPPLQAVGEEELRRRVMEAVASHRAEDGSYLITNELVHVVGRLPGAR